MPCCQPRWLSRALNSGQRPRYLANTVSLPRLCPACTLYMLAIIMLTHSGLTVLPYIVPFEADESVFAGETVQLNCQVSKGDLPLDIKWHFHGFDNSSSHLGIMTTKMTSRTSFLSIAAATASHSGNYTCVASNTAGSTNHSTVLNVHGQSHSLIDSLSVFVLCFSKLMLEPMPIESA